MEKYNKRWKTDERFYLEMINGLKQDFWEERNRRKQVEDNFDEFRYNHEHCGFIEAFLFVILSIVLSVMIYVVVA